MMQETPTEGNRCAATRADGVRCRARARPGRTLCFVHDPNLHDLRVRARSTGGRNSAALARALRTLPTDLRGVYDRLATALASVQEGTLEPNRAVAMAALSRAMVTVLDAAETLRRIAALEDMLDENC